MPLLFRRWHSQYFYHCVEHRLDCFLVLRLGGSFEIKIDVVLLGFVSKVLHLHSAIVVQVNLVSNKDFNSINTTDTLHAFIVVRNAFERRGIFN